MNWFTQCNKALDFIEDNLTEHITIEDVSNVALSSEFHFARMFQMLSSVTIGEYIRNRRLSEAAKTLLGSNKRVIDIAYDYQYATPESFTKAFKKFHGITPSEAKKGTHQLKSFPRLSFQLTIKGGKTVEYKIMRKDDLSFIGYEIDVCAVDGQNFVVIPKFWGEVMQDNRFQTLASLADETGILGICYNWDEETSTFKYMIGIADKGQTIENAKRVQFDPETFMAFTAKGQLPESIQRTTKYIYSEWFPSSNYEHTGGPELEVYPAGDTMSEDYVCYYWVPITTKK